MAKETLSDPIKLHKRQVSAQERALELAHTDFWGRIEAALTARGLPGLTGLSAPPEPNTD